ncbi:MAG: hybrid sensor histidine kinase/response regulator, partial [Anaerolineae bacterium]|nr:hybrid sensor histidine kinase/response regulator [Anaerolineae bacterium]
VQCAVPLGDKGVYIGTLDREGRTGPVPRVRLATVEEWRRLEQQRHSFSTYARHSFDLPEGRKGELVSRLAADTEGDTIELDLAPFAAVLGLALERCLCRREHKPDAGSDAGERGNGEGGGLSRAMEDDALRVLGEMAAGAAHDINNSLAVVLGQAQLGLIADSVSEMHQYFGTIERTSKDCAGIVRRLQEFSRGARRPRVQARVDLAGVARETIDITRPRWRDEAQRRGAYIKTVLDLATPLPVEGDAGALRQVLTNLVLNALDAMPAGGVLTLKGWVDGETVRLSVRDTGVGMSGEVMERLFEPFFTTKGEGGTGLGLSISKRIVEEHSGELEVSSQPGVGSVFTVSLPLAVGDAAVDLGRPDTPGGRPLRVLLIDDEPQVREVLMRMLRLDGHTATAAATAREGLQLLDAHEFDLVLTDLGLPDMPGWQLARAAKCSGKAVPVVLITGWTEEGDRPSAEGEVDAVLVKPFGIAELRQVMRTALDSHARAAS